MAHTPGPWHWREDDDDGTLNNSCAMALVGPDGAVIVTPCRFARGPRSDEPAWVELLREDARLIAAAPDLLAVLTALVADAEKACCPKTRLYGYEAAKAAIAKATGEVS